MPALLALQGAPGSDDEDEVLDALELVHQVEYAARSSVLEPLMAELEGAEPPPEEGHEVGRGSGCCTAGGQAACTWCPRPALAAELVVVMWAECSGGRGGAR
jgi:hypothetical protein